MDRMYEDKLDGKIDEEFWNRKMADWRTEERALQSAAESLNIPVPENRALTVQKILNSRIKRIFCTFAESCGTRSIAKNGTFELRN